MAFTGFSEEDLEKMKFTETEVKNEIFIGNTNIKKINKLGGQTKRAHQHYKSPLFVKQNSDEAIDTIFNKCKLSLKSPTTPPSVAIEDSLNNNNDHEKAKTPENNINVIEREITKTNEDVYENINISDTDNSSDERRNSVVTPDVVRCLDNYTEDDLAAHKLKLEELQLKQKIMEEQNKKRKEMLAKALADRTKQTEEEVHRLEKIKKELQVLDGQLSLDVSVLRKKIDIACLSYSEAEKHYLKIEKEFLQAKINLQKEKEKKELLTEHLCALITHNETRKAQKLEQLMLELANDKKKSIGDIIMPVDDKSMIIDGVDERTGKIVELPPDSEAKKQPPS